MDLMKPTTNFLQSLLDNNFSKTGMFPSQGNKVPILGQNNPPEIVPSGPGTPLNPPGNISAPVNTNQQESNVIIPPSNTVQTTSTTSQDNKSTSSSFIDPMDKKNILSSANKYNQSMEQAKTATGNVIESQANAARKVYEDYYGKEIQTGVMAGDGKLKVPGKVGKVIEETQAGLDAQINNYNQALQDYETRSADLTQRLEESTPNRKAFWDVATTGDKVSAALTTLGTLLSNLGNLNINASNPTLPPRAIESYDKIYNQINEVVDHDFKNQQIKYNTLLNLIDKSNTDWQTKQKAIVEVSSLFRAKQDLKLNGLQQEFNNTLEKAKLDPTIIQGLKDKANAEFEMKKQENNLNLQEKLATKIQQNSNNLSSTTTNIVPASTAPVKYFESWKQAEDTLKEVKENYGLNKLKTINNNIKTMEGIDRKNKVERMSAVMETLKEINGGKLTDNDLRQMFMTTGLGDIGDKLKAYTQGKKPDSNGFFDLTGKIDKLANELQDVGNIEGAYQGLINFNKIKLSQLAQKPDTKTGIGKVIDISNATAQQFGQPNREDVQSYIDIINMTSSPASVTGEKPIKK